MSTFYKIFWIIIIIGIAVNYYRWVHEYNEGLAQWQPVVAECSNHGGFMNAEGHCELNQ